MQMGTYTGGNGRMIRLMGLECTHIQIRHDMREIGLRTNSKVRVRKFGLTSLVMRGRMRQAGNMGLELLSSLMVQNIKEISS